MSNDLNKPKTLQDIANELGPPSQKIEKQSDGELMDKLTLAIVLSAIAPTKEQAEEIKAHTQKVMEMGLTQAEIETCKRRALGRLNAGGNSLAGLDKTL